MNKLFDYWMRLSIRVILLFATAMLVSFPPEYLREFFGDRAYSSQEFHHGMIDDKYEWGFRHSLYFLMCIILFVVQVVRIFAWTAKNENKFEV